MTADLACSTERKARSAPSNEFKSSTKGVKGEQYPLRHIQRDGATAATTPKYGAKLFVHARAAVGAIEIDRDGDASANFERP